MGGTCNCGSSSLFFLLGLFINARRPQFYPLFCATHIRCPPTSEKSDVFLLGWFKNMDSNIRLFRRSAFSRLNAVTLKAGKRARWKYLPLAAMVQAYVFFSFCAKLGRGDPVSLSPTAGPSGKRNYVISDWTSSSTSCGSRFEASMNHRWIQIQISFRAV